MSFPIFPEFKTLTETDFEAFQNFIKKFPPSSDFNLAGLWSYNVDNNASISLLNNNLVLRLNDYVTNEPFYTYLGTNKTNETINILLKFCKQKKVMKYLKLVLEDNFKKEKNISLSFVISEDRDNFDYIYSLAETSTLVGSKYQKQRGWINKLLKTYPNIKISQMDLDNIKDRQQIIKLFTLWGENKKLDNNDTEHELKALIKLIESRKYFNLILLGIFDKYEIIGFSLSEILENQYSMMHFVKANVNYFGVFQLIFRETAKIHLKHGAIYLNREQDLGIDSLRAAKLSWNPISFFKKYTISMKE
jgi:uncharacterized protein